MNDETLDEMAREHVPAPTPMFPTNYPAIFGVWLTYDDNSEAWAPLFDSSRRYTQMLAASYRISSPTPGLRVISTRIVELAAVPNAPF